MEGSKTKDGGLARIGIGAAVTTLIINLVVIFVSGIPGMYERMASNTIRVDHHERRMDVYEARLGGLEESIYKKLDQIKIEQRAEFQLLRKDIRDDYHRLQQRIYEAMQTKRE